MKALRNTLTSEQVAEPNGGESLHLGAMNTVSWSGLGLAGSTVKLELLVDGMVAGTIAEGIPGGQTSYQWQAGKMLGGWASAGTSYKVRVTAVAPPATSGTTYYVYDSGGRLLSEYDGTGACVKDYLYLGGKMIGEFVPSTGSYYYYASDQINSTRMVTDATGAVVHSAQYDPYGGLYKMWVDAYHPKPGFSGKEREFGSEMDYFGARYYGHGEYRFLSVDPIITKNDAANNSQLWNLYIYCINNPLLYTDPEGTRINPITRRWGIPGVSTAHFGLTPSGLIAMGGNYFGRGRWGAIRPNNRTHRGVDLIAHIGDPVYSAESGTITAINSEDTGQAGRRVVVRTADGTTLTYAHLNSIEDGLSIGGFVVEGQKIGGVGISGNANLNGNPLPGYFVHLHFAVNDSQGNSINAENWLNDTNYSESTFKLNGN